MVDYFYIEFELNKKIKFYVEDIMDLKIKVDIEELMQKLQNMLDDEFVTVELTINSGDYYDDFTLGLKALDISQEEDVEYGELSCVTDYFM